MAKASVCGMEAEDTREGEEMVGKKAGSGVGSRFLDFEHFGLRDRHTPSPYESFESDLWGIVLAGGEGKRFKDLAVSLYGYPRCKQYCAVVGKRSMIQHTLSRAEFLIRPERVVVVVNRDHEKDVQEQLGDRPPGTIVFQPRNRDTAAGVLLPLTYVAKRDPDALVVILPSDHFILEEDRFMAYVLRAKRLIERERDLCILLGIDAEGPETNYGWIEPADAGGAQDLFRVSAFYEKPDRGRAELLYHTGCLWNTLVLVARADTFLGMYKEQLPDLYKRFERVARVLETSREKEILEEAYATMPALNISESLLQRNPENLRTLRVSGVLWSDWGSSARVRQTLERIGRLDELVMRLAKRHDDPELFLDEN